MSENETAPDKESVKTIVPNEFQKVIKDLQRYIACFS